MADTKSKVLLHEEIGTSVSIRDFVGMAPNQDPHDLQLGQTVVQINVGVGPRGELRSRGGAAVVKFDP